MNTKINTLLALFIMLTFNSYAEWERHEYKEHGFSIAFPDTPKNKPGEHFNTLTSKGEVAYQVMYLNKDMDFSGDKSGFYDQAIGMYQGTEEGTRESLNLNGLEGVQTKIVTSGMKGHLQVYVSDTRIYILASLKKGEYPSESVSKKYFKTFEYYGSTSASSSASTQTSVATAPVEEGFDCYSYFNSKSFPLVDNINSVEPWMYGDFLKSMVRTDISDMKTIIQTYGAEQLKDACYAGKEGVRWYESLSEIHSLFPQIINQYLSQEVQDNRMLGMAELEALKLIQELASDFHAAVESNETKLALDKATEQYNKRINASKFVKGDFYKTHLSEPVLFKNEVALGEEKENMIAHELHPDKGTFLRGYFPLPLANAKNYIGLLLKSKNQTTHYQKLFVWNKDEEAYFNSNGAADINFFPNPDKLDYKSAYQYDVHINLLTFLLMHENGNHIMNIGFTTSHMANTQPQVGHLDLRLNMTESLRKRINTLRDKLIEARINTQSIPDPCVDNSGIISNKDAFAQYGKLLKYVQTEPVGAVKESQWPYTLLGYATGGWAAIERPSGEIELIPIGLFKKVNTEEWRFTAISTIPPDYELRGNGNYYQGRGEFGYILTLDQLSKCQSWE